MLFIIADLPWADLIAIFFCLIEFDIELSIRVSPVFEEAWLQVPTHLFNRLVLEPLAYAGARLNRDWRMISAAFV